MKVRGILFGLLALAFLTATLPAAAQLGPGPFAAFPTSDETDGRFLGFGCPGLQTFESGVSITLAAQPSETDFTLSIFDGDSSGSDPFGHWDIGDRQLLYSLYFDPFRQGNTNPADLVGQWTGNAPNPPTNPVPDPNKQWTTSAATMPDNDWWGVTIQTSAPAQAMPGANFFYHLRIDADGTCAPLELLEANIKVAASAPLNFAAPRFAFVAALRQLEDIGVIYPGAPFPDLPGGRGYIDEPTTNDGTFQFALNIPPGATTLNLYDGDFDHGTDPVDNFGIPSGVPLNPCMDLDDPDTPADYGNFPSGVGTAGADPEGAVPFGQPADDVSFDIFRRGEPASADRLGCVRYEITDPDGNVYANNNPSSNVEWEQFRIVSLNDPDAGDPSLYDHLAPTPFLTPGTWDVRVVGLDMSNLNFWFAEFGVCSSLENPQFFMPLDFEKNGFGNTVASGVVVAEQWANLGIHFSTNDPVNHPIKTFDSAFPFALELDLGTPNVDFFGLGVGAGGGAGQPGENRVPQRNILVIADSPEADGNYDGGGVIIVTFDSPRQLSAVELLDIEEAGGTVQAFDSPVGGSLLASAAIPTRGDNGFVSVPLVSPGVRRLEITLVGEGGVVAIRSGQAFTPSCPPPVFALGDTVFYDDNGNGTQNPGDDGIAGVVMELLANGNPTPIASAITGDTANPNFSKCRSLNTGLDEQGLYCFLVPSGDYTVRVAASNFASGQPLFGLGSTTGGETQTNTVSNANVMTYDFGYRGTGSIGDRVWRDNDGDGVQDGGGETGINGVTVRLLDADDNVIDTQVTAGDGGYLFSNLGPGDYTVEVIPASLPAGLDQTYDLDGVGTPNSAAVSLAAGQNRTDVDFGYRGTASIGDRVWLDLDGDGVQDGGGETGINGVTVRLRDAGNNVIGTQVTSGDGNYLFTNLAAGTYTVEVDSTTLPAGLAQTYDLDGLGTPHRATASLAAGQNRIDVDFGYKPATPVCTAGYMKDTFTTASFSNNEGTLAWSAAWIENDVAGAGPGSGNVTVGTPVSGYLILRDSPDTGTQPSAAREANLSGFASAMLSFDFHIRGVETDDAAVVEVSNNGGASYTVLETFTGLTGTTISSRSYDITAYKASNTRIRFRISNLYGGDDDFFKLDLVRIDATCVPPQTGSVGDRVWKDSDGDGIQDGGEPGINGVTVQLLNSGGTVVATQVTSGNGNYLFSGLNAGTYSVRVVSSTVPAGYSQTYDLDGTGSAHIASFSLGAGQNRTDVDFGYRPAPVCTAGYLKDTFTTAGFSNNEGTLNFNGSWIEYDVAGAGASSGNVTVGTPVAGYMILRDSPDTGTQPSVAREANLSGFASATLSFDFHIRGVEADDAAVVEVSNNGGASYTVLETFTGYTGTTISSRSYDITAYKATNTRIRFRISNLYGGDDDFFKLDVVRIDAACVPQTGSVGDRVWKDSDGDGVQDSGETGLNGVTVELLNSGGTVIATQVTSGNGNYLFSGLAAGTYKVRVKSTTVPSGYTQTYDLDGTGTAHLATFTLAAGQNRTDVDFGYKPAPACTAGYFKDNFGTASFSNNDGTLSWSAAWVESDSAGAGVSSGNVTVGTPYSGYLILDDNPDTGTQPSAARQANLSGFVTATLKFDFHTTGGTDADDAAVIEVSNNGGASYTVLQTITGLTGTNVGSKTFNISAYISSNTRIRFRISANYGAADEMFKVDTVRIDTTCP